MLTCPEIGVKAQTWYVLKFVIILVKYYLQKNGGEEGVNQIMLKQP